MKKSELSPVLEFRNCKYELYGQHFLCDKFVATLFTEDLPSYVRLRVATEQHENAIEVVLRRGAYAEPQWHLPGEAKKKLAQADTSVYPLMRDWLLRLESLANWRRRKIHHMWVSIYRCNSKGEELELLTPRPDITTYPY